MVFRPRIQCQEPIIGPFNLFPFKASNLTQYTQTSKSLQCEDLPPYPEQLNIK